MRYGIICLLLAFFAILSSCGSTSPGDARIPVVSAGGSTMPTITWRPGGAQAIHIYRGRLPGSDYDLVWSIRAELRNGIQSPVTYGLLPPGATSDAGPVPLRQGTLYTIVVERVEPTGASSGSDSLAVFEGRTTFLP